MVLVRTRGFALEPLWQKEYAYGTNIKLIAVPTLELLCVPVLLHHEEIEDNALLVPMIDARRMEVYAQVFDRALQEVGLSKPML